MLISCPSCGERSPDGAGTCIDCGAPLHMLAPMARCPGARAARPALQLARKRRSASEAMVWLAARWLPIAGLLFAVVFSCGLASYLADGWTRSLGFWPAAVLVLGALLSQQALLHGQLWRGVCGMALWGGLIWLLAAHLVVPWVGVLLLGWALFRPIAFFRRVGLRTARAR